jgi:hypothetical protein
MGDKIKQVWDYIQSFLDVRGDVVMLFMSIAFVLRVLAVLKGYPGLNPSESALYASAIGAFAWSNKG